MTFCTSFAPVPITGLVNGWNRGLDLTSLGIVIPSDATYLKMEYRAGTGTAYGFGKFGNGTTTTYTATGNASIVKFVELSADKKIDLYLANATSGVTVAQWHCLDVLNHYTPIAPVSIGAFAGAGTKTIDCSAILPSGAVNGSALISFNLNMKVGALANITTQEFPNLTPDNHRLVPLDANRCFYVNSGGAAINAGDIKILAWALPDCVTFATTFPKLAIPTALTGWDGTGFRVSTGAMDFYQVHATSDSQRRALRTNGNTAYTTNQTAAHRTAWVRPDVDGLIQGWRDNTNVSFIYMGSMVANTAVAEIVSIDTFEAGATATVVFNMDISSITKLRVTCAVLMPDGVTPIDTHYIDISTGFSGSNDEWTFTVPELTNGADGIRLGAVKIAPTTNFGTGADFTGKVYSVAGYSSVNIETPVEGNICEGDIPSLATSDQLAWDYGLISREGIYSDPSETNGTQTIWRYIVSEFKWYSFELTTEGGSGGGGSSLRRTLKRTLKHTSKNTLKGIL